MRSAARVLAVIPSYAKIDYTLISKLPRQKPCRSIARRCPPFGGVVESLRPQHSLKFVASNNPKPPLLWAFVNHFEVMGFEPRAKTSLKFDVAEVQGLEP